MRRLARLFPAIALLAASPVASAQDPGTAPPATTQDDVSPGTAGYHNGSFYVRSPDDVFRLYVFGRAHADYTNQFAAGTAALPPGNGINSGFFLRRARLEIAGEFYQTWQWQVSAEFASGTATDNPGAIQETPTCSVDPTTAAPTCADRESPIGNATVRPIPTDVFVNYGPSAWANVEVGQFYLPFTLENRISDNTTPFLERSLPVRAIGAPNTRDIGAMFWGESPNRVLYYAVGLFNGDGPNRPNIDARYDVSARVFVRPFVMQTSSPMKWAQIGASARGGSRDPSSVGYDMPALTTQDGFAFWKPTYEDSLARTLHILPSGSQWAVAGDVYLPIDGFDFTSEFIYASSNTREAVDGLQLSPFTERTGTFRAYGWYAQVGYWVVGDHEIIGHPSYGRPVHVDLTKPQVPARQGLQATAKFEQLHATYDGASRGGVADRNTPNGDVDANTIEIGLSYWATRHLRVGLNGATYFFGNDAKAPAQYLAKGIDDSARTSSRTLNEISVRVGVQF